MHHIQYWSPSAQQWVRDTVTTRVLVEWINCPTQVGRWIEVMPAPQQDDSTFWEKYLEHVRGER